MVRQDCYGDMHYEGPLEPTVYARPPMLKRMAPVTPRAWSGPNRTILPRRWDRPASVRFGLAGNAKGRRPCPLRDHHFASQPDWRYLFPVSREANP